MKLIVNSQTPQFETTDVYGKPISMASFKGKKLLLSFMRFGGCPVCNLRVHQLVKHAQDFKDRNIEVVLVYESEKKTMLEYIGTESFPFTFVADPSSKLYNLFSIEKSWKKFFSSLFNGLFSKAMQGQRLFKKKIKTDGSITRIEADFLIDENGKVLIAHYGKFVGDDLPIEKILSQKSREKVLL